MVVCLVGWLFACCLFVAILHLLHHGSALSSARYAVLFPHRYVTTTRVASLGEAVHSISMSMPGGCSYEAVVVRTHQGNADQGNAGTLTVAAHGMGPRKRIDKGEDEKEEQEEQEEQEQEEQEEHGKNAQKKAESKGKGTGAKQAKGSNGVAARSNTFGAGAADHSAHDALPSPSIVGAADPHLRTAVSSVRACAFACACTCVHVHSCVCVCVSGKDADVALLLSLSLSLSLLGERLRMHVWCGAIVGR